MNAVIAIVIAALIQVESGGRDNATGDNGRAVGCLQMWPIAVMEANRIEGLAAKREGRTARTWTTADRYSRRKSVEMATVTLEYHYRRGVVDPVDLGARWRNPNGNAPQWYKDKIRRAMK